jgi:uncharacterized protein YjeT (DUF2065 family)
MEQPDTGKMTDEQRRLIGLVFLFIGVTDIALGVAIAVFGPGFIGGEPLVDKVLLICGVALALGGVGIIWFGHQRFGARRGEGSTSSVFKA